MSLDDSDHEMIHEQLKNLNENVKNIEYQLDKLVGAIEIYLNSPVQCDD